MIIEVEDLNFSYDEPVLKDISFSIGQGQVVGLLGSNGSGKSTLFKLMLGLLRPDSGSISLMGKDLEAYSSRDLARVISYVAQSHQASYNHRVVDVVSMGYASQIGILARPSQAQKERALDLLDYFGIKDLASRGYQDISGGQRQLVMIARAMVQDAGIILMDEPVANLDFGNQALILKTIQQISKDKDYTIILSMHDPLQAYQYTDSVLVLDEKRILAQGRTDQVLSKDLLEKIYKVDISLYELNHGGKTIYIPLVE